jgi:hypothetical protein
MKIKAIDKHRFSLIKDISKLLQTKFNNYFHFNEDDIYIEINDNDILSTTSLMSIAYKGDSLHFQFSSSIYTPENFDLELPDETLSYIKNILTSEKATS